MLRKKELEKISLESLNCKKCGRRGTLQIAHWEVRHSCRGGTDLAIIQEGKALEFKESKKHRSVVWKSRAYRYVLECKDCGEASAEESGSPRDGKGKTIEDAMREMAAKQSSSRMRIQHACQGRENQ